MMKNPSYDTLSFLYSNKVKSCAFVYMGGSDEYRVADVTTYKTALESFFSNVHLCYIPDGNHSFIGLESTVADSIIGWINSNNLIYNDACGN